MSEDFQASIDALVQDESETFVEMHLLERRFFEAYDQIPEEDRVDACKYFADSPLDQIYKIELAEHLREHVFNQRKKQRELFQRRILNQTSFQNCA